MAIYLGDFGKVVAIFQVMEPNILCKSKLIKISFGRWWRKVKNLKKVGFEKMSFWHLPKVILKKRPADISNSISKIKVLEKKLKISKKSVLKI